jgi:hypothetical protein
MTSKRSPVRQAFLWFLTLQLAGFTCPLFVPKAHALYWEDSGDPNNDPSQTKRRPDHFSLFDWVGDLDRDSKKKHYADMDNHDKGPSVNNGARTLEVIASGLVGLGLGLLISNRLSGPNDDVSSNMFIGGALGLGLGVAVGALIMPQDYQVDQQARIDFLKQRQAWLQDPLRLEVQKAFLPADMNVTLKF